MSASKPLGLVHYALVFGIGAFMAGLLASWLTGNLSFVATDAAGNWLMTFWGRFQVMFVLSVLIERSVETYLNATRQNGESAIDAVTGNTVKTKDAKQAAMQAALVLSVLVALAGVRVIETLVQLDASASVIKAAVWHGIDILVSAGLMAGGADLFHKIASVITSGLELFRSNLQGSTPKNVSAPVDARTVELTHRRSVATSLLATKTYSILISRQAAPAEEGLLEFADGGLKITAKCWWDKNNRIDADVYLNCSKTYMATSLLEGIYLPDAKSKVTGLHEIFLHRGSSPDNSLGCIAVNESDFNTLWNHISPLNGRNVTVTIKDV